MHLGKTDSKCSMRAPELKFGLKKGFLRVARPYTTSSVRSPPRVLIGSDLFLLVLIYVQYLVSWLGCYLFIYFSDLDLLPDLLASPVSLFFFKNHNGNKLQSS